MNLARTVRMLYCRQWVQHPLEEVFLFFERPENLALITPPWLGLRLRTPRQLTMRAGLVTYEPPLRSLAALLDHCVIRRQLAAIFEYRRERIAGLLGAGSAASRRRASPCAPQHSPPGPAAIRGGRRRRS
jgi:ligand-binding SRPBCC domain-containing protein